MGKIHIVGLGPGDPMDLSLKAIDRMKNGGQVYLRTEDHPSVVFLKDQGIDYESFDRYYEEGEDFNQVYERIVDRLLEESESQDIVYCVPGDPMVAEKTVKLLLDRKEDLEIVSAMSFIEPLLRLVKTDPIEGLQILDGSDFKLSQINFSLDTILTQVYNKRILSDIKLLLSDIYGDTYPVYLINGAGVEAIENSKLLQVYQLDRQDEVGLLTSIFIPKVEENSLKLFDIGHLLDIMYLLRSNEGCPWDREQTIVSLRDYLVEEAFEVIEAIDQEDYLALEEELGDLLLQIVFISQIAYEEGDFNFFNVTSSIVDKLIRRHPHVFEDRNLAYDWQGQKDKEGDYKSFTDSLKAIKNGSSLLKAYKIQEKAKRIGFDWEELEEVFDKIDEEVEEVKESLKLSGLGSSDLEGEVGDLLFSVVNLSRFLKVNPEISLKKTIDKFLGRFDIMEAMASSEGKSLEDLDFLALDKLWDLAKASSKVELY